MSLPEINIDDRDFDTLVNESLKHIRQTCPQWTDLSHGDPGRALIEVFAYITENLIYRTNRIPRKVYIEFLRLLGIKLQPPKAARTTLRFSLSTAQSRDVEIPQHTRVTLNRSGGDSEPPSFITVAPSRIPSGSTECDIEAVNGEAVEGEFAGHGSGLPNQWIKASRPPLVTDIDLIVGVEAEKDELSERVDSITWGEKTYRIWKEVETFANPGEEKHVYTADRVSGIITFAPDVEFLSQPQNEKRNVLGYAVPEGREIRLWYVRGGGEEGNVEKEQLTVLKDPVAGYHVTVTNINPATGGSPAETFENALLRGPLQFRSLERAVTADDVELIAKQVSGAISRAKAFTKADLWKHAQRGTVEVLIVPSIPGRIWSDGYLALEVILGQQKAEVCDHIRSELERRTPLGVTVSVEWIKYKRVAVEARVVVTAGEKLDSLRNRVLNRINKSINPLPSESNTNGWEFNKPLRISNVYDIILSEPAVKYADKVKLVVDHAPSTDVTCIRADEFQKGMWYASSGSSLYRTSNDGEGWELIYQFSSEEIKNIECHPNHPGLVAVNTEVEQENGKKHSKIHLSFDCGESRNWRILHQTGFEVEDMTWSERDGDPVLLLAAENGLYELKLGENAIPVHIMVDSQNPSRGFYSVTAAKDIKGVSYVALSSKKNGGIFISDRQGRAGTFLHAGLKGEDIRILSLNQYGGRTYLWAGVTVAGNETGKGCFRLELRAEGISESDWTHFGENWNGGSCFSLAFHNENVFSGSHNSGVLQLDSGSSDASWRRVSIDSGLPFRNRDNIFEPITALEADPKKKDPFLMAGGPKGVFTSKNTLDFEISSKKEYSEKVTIPPNWLFCSAPHSITVEIEDEIG